MDIQLLTDRLPLPSLELYVGLSFLAAASSLYYIWAESQQLYLQNIREHNSFEFGYHNVLHFQNNTLSTQFLEDEEGFCWYSTLDWASQQPHYVWPLVNLAYCFLILLSQSLQKLVFGNLRVSEGGKLKEQFWNLIFYKIVFIFGVVNVQEIEDAIGWCFFVSAIGLLQLARQLSKERHNYLILTNDWTRRSKTQRWRILCLLVCIFLISIAMFLGVCFWYMYSDLEQNLTLTSSVEFSGEDNSNYNFNLGLHNALFMTSEIFLLVIQTLHVLSISLFEHFKQKHQRKLDSYVPYPGNAEDQNQQCSISHSINFYFDISALLLDLIHHLHMLVCCNGVSMTSLIVTIQMRARARQFHTILKKRQSFTWLAKHIAKYPNFTCTPENANEICAICWETMITKKPIILPCKHVFHTTCLKKWLLVTMNCPTCRYSLLSDEAELKQTRRSRSSRRLYYDPSHHGLWGFLQTGQTLLDLFGGWDPQVDEPNEEEIILPRAASLFGDFVVRNLTVEAS